MSKMGRNTYSTVDRCGVLPVSVLLQEHLCGKERSIATRARSNDMSGVIRREGVWDTEGGGTEEKVK